MIVLQLFGHVVALILLQLLLMLHFVYSVFLFSDHFLELLLLLLNLLEDICQLSLVLLLELTLQIL